MAAAQVRRQCGNNESCKQPAAANCEGCSQAFCIKHLLNHRQALNDEMNIIIGDHDQLQHTLSQQAADPHSHSCLKAIDRWEQESIGKIQRKAVVLREQILGMTADHTKELLAKLRQLSVKLVEGRENETFIETDLRRWRISLEELKANLTSPSAFQLDENKATPLVPNLSIRLTTNGDAFESTSDPSVTIEDDGQVARHDRSEYHYTEVRGKGQYTSTRQTIRLQIEESSDAWMFLGVNSLITPLQNSSCILKSTYGWSSNNLTWLKGQQHPNRFESTIEMKKNDIIRLILDCAKREIIMINERTNTQHQLTVNLEFCPFPWQLDLILMEPNSRVRLLSTSSEPAVS